MGILFITDQHNSEPDILMPLSREVLHIRSLEGTPLAKIPAPSSGWTHDRLKQVQIDPEVFRQGADAYLGSEWVGSTEV